MPTWFSFGFQDRRSISIGELVFLHDHIIVIILIIIFLIFYIIFYLVLNSRYYKFLSEGTFIETVWSIIPAFLLFFLVIPSMQVLYFMEDIKNPSFSIKVVAHQWYWTYICPLFNNLSFKLSNSDSVFSLYEYDSMLDEDFSMSPRLLSSSSDLYIPVNTVTRFLITSTDVIHSFAIPSLGLKVDAVPGRINQLFSNPSRVGSFFGQCSEICGSNHSFMPISIKVCGNGDFNKVSSSYFLDILEESNLTINILGIS